MNIGTYTSEQVGRNPDPDRLWGVGIGETWTLAGRSDVKTVAMVRRVVKDSFRRRRGLDPDGRQDPEGCFRHRWMESFGILECKGCGDVDDLLVPGGCPSEGFRPDVTSCRIEERPAEGCSWIHRYRWPHPLGSYDDFLREEEEKIEMRLSEEEEDRGYVEQYTYGWSGRGEYVDKGDPRLDNLRPISPRPEEPAIWDPPAVAPTTLKELRELAKQRGIRRFSRMDGRTLCDLLGVPPIEKRSRKPVSITLTNQETGEVLKFPSISGASKYLGVNPGSIAHYVKSAGRIKADRGSYTVGKEIL